ncbi:MAG: Na(+)-translocating NADH-quinone reductase subunit A [Rhodobacteraceae bacterium]|nr:Na(+)-translocating NADH-quinone reductase subunit A [Paracoccaceae bacterium]
MEIIKIKKGLDIPATGAPEQKIYDGQKVSSVALVGADYLGLKPKMLVQEQDKVTRGTPLFCNKDDAEAVIVAPVTGRVRAINRGARRVLQSVVIDIDDAEDKGIDFSSTGDAASVEGLVEKLCAAGLWTSFRARPYSKVPHHSTRPTALYVTAMDSEPLSADAHIIINERKADFETGINAIAKLCDGPTYLCQSADYPLSDMKLEGISEVGFSGPHPSGLAGTHMHFLTPPTSEKVVWTISYQDVLAIGALLRTGHIDPTVVVALSGPLVKKPRLIKTMFGASLEDLVVGEALPNVPARVISGSILSGRLAEGPFAFLGRYSRQITLMEEDHKQIPMGWIRPMPSKYSVQPVLGSALSKKLYAFTTNLNGGRRAMVPTGTFERLMPQDFLPTQLLRSLLVMDTDTAQALGALELDEEDLGLVGFACPAKYEYGSALRDCLEKIEKEG